MKAKKLDVNRNIYWVLSSDLNSKKIDNTAKNIVVSAAILKRLLFVPRSTRAERGTNKSGTKADGF